ncbi:bifunctional glutamate N-acetyltransferase/amino-acid acetyltransferase ArgJ [Lactobacillus sp. LC28-10]|uniref:Arginine biosynthesis bifunctional protein ArgJ n=1 Tax=Secundilactobacillus angelensis TaxID=2722706 RepID=A0ABX1L058_9LACO|nr:bifunctional glutamate N-acetyltransferase/amino-acid acetyltransferase ArgJ [Secundilactobacillus angelensis]MCH5462035.1 bifunctional glutamate N-acetyltransferase/amino-acid acetyltransferase ArgJ [Secundilactobacillus angelensis]NLR19572.1 bifunctional glutamate N-acetyltransferase/amino-acid acetyltransferase ArgJ [Secundilactobacillus angelensis]
MIETKDITLTSFQWPAGYYNDGIEMGIGQSDKLDFGYLVSEVPASAAGTYTTNKFQAAPTKLTKNMINQDHQLQAMVVNSAIANSCTGEQGEDNALTEQQLLSEKLGIDAHLVGVASTGLIGAQLPMDKVIAGIKQLSPHHEDNVTKAVLTTDKHSKQACVQLEMSGKTVTITGFAKGSGMIHPKMATMLGFVTTDAAIDGKLLQATLSENVDTTFNQITVDGDTSTNDMVVVMANGMAGAPKLTSKEDADFSSFQAGLHLVLQELAKQIAADGEGATKLVECNVNGAFSDLEGQEVAKAIVGSNLVKSAIFGQDPNWGRIISTVGMTNAHVDIAHVDIEINGIKMVQDSLALPFDEQMASDSMGANKVVIDVNLHVGSATGQAWGCDLTYNYVKINASYHT